MFKTGGTYLKFQVAIADGPEFWQFLFKLPVSATFAGAMVDSLGFIVGNMLLVVPVVLVVRRIYQWIKEEDISY